MKLKIFYVLIILFSFSNIAHGSVIELGGDNIQWYGNGTMDNVIDFEEKNNLTLLPTIYDDFKSGINWTLWKNSTEFPPTISYADGEVTITSNASISPAESYVFSGLVYQGENYTIGSNFTVKNKAALSKMVGGYILDHNETLIIAANMYSAADGRQYTRYRTGSTTVGADVAYNIMNANEYYISKSNYIDTTDARGYYYYTNGTEIYNVSVNPWDSSNPSYVGMGSVYVSQASIYDWVHNEKYNTNGNYTYNASEYVTTGKEIKNIQYNGTGNVSLYASTDGIIYILIATNATSGVNYSVSGEVYKYVRYNLKTTNNATSPNIPTSIIEYGDITGSVDIIYYNVDYDNLTANCLINISNKTEPLTNINLSWSTNNSNTYCFNYPNSTPVQECITSTYEGMIAWFNGSADRLPELDGYFINETLGVSTIIIPANSLGMFNNWTTATTFSAIAANESNDKAYYFYNVSSGEWESYDPGYSWNANNVICKDNSVIGFFNAETTITADIITPSSTELHEGWNMLAVQGSDNETIADIKSNIGANCTDVWKFNSTAGDYSNTTTDSLQPNEGFLVYINTTFTWPRSDL